MSKEYDSSSSLLGSYRKAGRLYYKWDYCSPNNKVTIYGEKCNDICRSSRYSYSWCHTETSWDYCSSSGVGRSMKDGDTPVVGSSLYWLFVLPCAVILAIGGYKVYTGTNLCKS